MQRCCWRGPQSVQSVQMSQSAYSAPGPPSSQMPSDKYEEGPPPHVSLQIRMSMPGAKGGGLGGGGLNVIGRAQRTQPSSVTQLSDVQRMELPRGTCTFIGPC